MPCSLESYQSGGEAVPVEVFVPSAIGPVPSVLIVHGSAGLGALYKADIVSFADALSARGIGAVLPHYFVAAKLKGSLTVVVINNEGGGIFGHLPVAKFDPPFEEYWATPQKVEIAKLCAAYGVPHRAVGSASSLRTVLRAQIGEPGLRVIEVKTDRKKDVETRRRLFAEAARVAGEALG